MVNGAAIAEARKAKGWTQEDLLVHARMAGHRIALRTLQDVENERAEPKYSTAAAIADALGLSLDDLRKPERVSA